MSSGASSRSSKRTKALRKGDDTGLTAMPRPRLCARQRQVAVHHQLCDRAQVESKRQPEIRLRTIRLDDLRHHGEVYRGEQEMVRVIHVYIFTKQHALGPLGDETNARSERITDGLAGSFLPVQCQGRDRGGRLPPAVPGNPLRQRRVLVTRVIGALRRMVIEVAAMTASLFSTVMIIAEPCLVAYIFVVKFTGSGKNHAGSVYRPRRNQ